MLGGSLDFATPWVLGFLAALPVLWWLLRLTPPSPRKMVFPALMLLRGLATPEQTPARTPWWLLLLRLVIAALIIAAFAGPRLDPQPILPGAGAVLIAIDNDWAAARAWDVRQDALRRLLGEAEHENRDVILLPTAPPANGEAMQIIGPIAAKAAYAYAERLAPMPWPADWRKAEALLGTLDKSGVAYSLWLNSGLGGRNAARFFATLKSYGELKEARVLSDPEIPIYTLVPPKTDEGKNTFSVMRANTDNAAIASLAALGEQGQVLAHVPVNFTAGAPRATATFDLPLDVHNQVTRLAIEGSHTVAATLLLDEDWQHRPVGLIGDKAEETEHSLLSGLFYIDRALKPFADIHIDQLDKLLGENMAVLILTDATPLGPRDIPRLEDWIKKGGVFVRFAGDRLASEQNPQDAELLPVALRTGDRAMGGTMSWSTPQKLRAFPAASPFEGLAIPPDVTVSRQILAEPSADLGRKTWAELEDGTPLVTVKTIGGGLSILFHVPARSEWSNLPLSGLFVDMLRRIVDLSHGGNTGDLDFSPLAPQQMLDAFGDLQPPGRAVRPIEGADFFHTEAGPDYPPGYYGHEGLKHALNLGPSIGQPERLEDIATESYRAESGETDLQSPLLAAAFILLLADFLLSLGMRGILAFRRPVRDAGRAVLVLFLATVAFHSARAADDKTAVTLTSETYLAYVETGDSAIDRISKAGLEGLAHILQRRTSLDQIGVAGVDPATDELVFFPLLYWPLSPAAAPVSPRAVEHVNDYLRYGGMILFDSESGALSAATMQTLLAGINIPPLVPIPDNHVLRHSFYLLDEFPGRTAGGELWLEPEETATFDGVATVIAGSGDWAGAWAVDENGRPLFPCTPGGEIQREYAYRFGVNLVMYALTGNYKSDQLHAQALLERLGK